MGPITESVDCLIEGRAEPTRLLIRGFSRAPSFTCSPEMLDFGELSLGYPIKKTVLIKNSSWIPVGFEISCKEADISVDVKHKELDPEQETEVEVTLEPSKIGIYKTRVDLVLSSVNACLGTLFVTGMSVVPQFSLTDTNLQLGTCFLGHQYKKMITIANDSEFKGKFQIHGEDSEVAEVFVSPKTGDLMQQVGFHLQYFEYHSLFPRIQSAEDLEIQITPLRLGQLEMLLFIETQGSTDPPLEIFVECLCIGPVLELTSEDERFNAEKSKIDFGRVKVLESNPVKLTITNTSPIKAEFQLFTNPESSTFMVSSSCFCPYNTHFRSKEVAVNWILVNRLRSQSLLVWMLPNGCRIPCS